MPAAAQLQLPFACLDFPGRETVAVWEIAAKLGVSRKHILDHIDAGTIVAVDTKIVSTRSNMRVPVDEYRRWVLVRLTGPARRTFLAELPESVLLEIARESCALLGLHFPGAAAMKSPNAQAAGFCGAGSRG